MRVSRREDRTHTRRQPLLLTRNLPALAANFACTTYSSVLLFCIENRCSRCSDTTRFLPFMLYVYRDYYFLLSEFRFMFSNFCRLLSLVSYCHPAVRPCVADPLRSLWEGESVTGRLH